MPKPPTKIYLDTSAYLHLILRDKNFKLIEKTLKGSTICTSVLLIIETERNLVRLSRERKLTQKEFQRLMDKLRTDLHFMIIRNVSVDLALNNSFPAVSTPRTSDLIHLRTAEWFNTNGGIAGFLSCDIRQLSAAKEMGLVVISVL